MDCAANHRSLGTHISFVRSTMYDSWTEGQLRQMEVGGNGRARAYFRRAGIDTLKRDDIDSKYRSRAAETYREQIKNEVHGKKGSGGTFVLKNPVQQPSPKEEKGKEKETVTKEEKGKEKENVTFENSWKPTKLTEAKPSSPVESPQLATRKITEYQNLSTTKTTGLGAKKADTANFDDWDKWGEEEEEEEQVTKEPTRNDGNNNGGGEKFDREEKRQEKKDDEPKNLRGHYAIDSRPRQTQTTTYTAYKPRNNDSVNETHLARNKFAGAKSISSDEFNDDNKDSRVNDSEKTDYDSEVSRSKIYIKCSIFWRRG